MCVGPFNNPFNAKAAQILNRKTASKNMVAMATSNLMKKDMKSHKVWWLFLAYQKSYKHSCQCGDFVLHPPHPHPPNPHPPTPRLKRVKVFAPLTILLIYLSLSGIQL